MGPDNKLMAQETEMPNEPEEDLQEPVRTIVGDIGEPESLTILSKPGYSHFSRLCNSPTHAPSREMTNPRSSDMMKQSGQDV